ncbi:hypothetical protein D3C80_2058950 [compost metagenome]
MVGTAQPNIVCQGDAASKLIRLYGNRNFVFVAQINKGQRYLDVLDAFWLDYRRQCRIGENRSLDAGIMIGLLKPRLVNRLEIQFRH